ncbi:FAD-dependent oxidoreductase [Endozoicomonas lisbonensis]|uniref:FAD-dependent oxidoreductase n=1 Tax=Endozoicomonas lisbonensis TaxID=3120522 RepID=UPI003395FA29
MAKYSLWLGWKLMVADRLWVCLPVVLVAGKEDAVIQRMKALYKRCQENGIEVEWLDAKALKEREPNITGVGALYVKATGIVDYKQVTRAMARCFEQLGGEVQLRSNVVFMEETSHCIRLEVQNDSGHQELMARYLVCCSGLMADRTTRMLGIRTDFQIIPYRGEYYQLAPQHNHIVNHLIYPIPDPDLPFLGVHLTRMMDGSVTVGPNAVQGWKRERVWAYQPEPEGYAGYADVCRVLAGCPE